MAPVADQQNSRCEAVTLSARQVVFEGSTEGNPGDDARTDQRSLTAVG